ncbi:hypothetical protein M5E89_04210 [Acidaminococcus intestini]|nr:hypothetical protein M5E89_04210 [Acidaminococcus intestini]
MSILVVLFKFNIGLVSFAVAAVLLMFHCASESKSFKGVPWGVLIMVSGVSTLMSIVIKTGGIKLLTLALSSLMTPFTGSAIMGATAGIMSLFSSGLGVVFPTLLPTVSSVAETVGGLNPIELGSLVVIGGTITGLSPVSTTGGMIMALLMADEQDNQEKEQKSSFPSSSGALRRWCWFLCWPLLVCIGWRCSFGRSKDRSDLM